MTLPALARVAGSYRPQLTSAQWHCACAAASNSKSYLNPLFRNRFAPQMAAYRPISNRGRNWCRASAAPAGYLLVEFVHILHQLEKQADPR